MEIEYTKAPDSLLHLAQALIENQPHHEQLLLEEASIGFLLRNYAALKHGRAVFSETLLVPEKLKPYIPHDFVIIVAEDEWNRAETAQREAELDHALCHCMYQQGRPKIRPHDVEEFAIVIKTYGPYRRELARAQSAFEMARQGSLFPGVPTLAAVDPEAFPFGG